MGHSSSALLRLVTAGGHKQSSRAKERRIGDKGSDKTAVGEPGVAADGAGAGRMACAAAGNEVVQLHYWEGLDRRDGYNYWVEQRRDCT